MQEKIKAILKKLDTEYDAIYDKAMWCGEHNFRLEAIALHEKAKAIGKIRIMIIEEFDIE